MPWDIRKRGNRYCVVKKGSSSPVPGGCHATREKAERHRRALYAGEKATSETEGSVMSVRFGSTENLYTISMDTGTTSGSFRLVPVEETEDETAIEWEGPIGYEGIVTSDKRLLMEGKISERELPLTFMVQTVNEEGHRGSEVGGKITKIWREKDGDGIAIMGRGAFDAGEFGQEAARMVEDEVLRGVSLDLAPNEIVALDPDTLEPLEEEDLDIVGFFNGDYVTGVGGEIMGATLCPFPAFADAKIAILTASGKMSVEVPVAWEVTRPVITASAAGKAPLKPPAEWFDVPEPSEPTPLTVTDDGRVYGHLAVWGQCHTSPDFNYCQQPPRSVSDYKFFHLGEIESAEGDRIPVGKITVGTPHAPLHYGGAKTQEHYDNTGCVAAFVRAKDGARGIWLSGAVRNDVPSEKIRDLRANPPSGDWRIESGSLELQGVLAVPVPGYPVPRSEAHLVASGGSEELTALVVTENVDELANWRKRKRKRAMLSLRRRAIGQRV